MTTVSQRISSSVVRTKAHVRLRIGKIATQQSSANFEEGCEGCCANDGVLRSTNPAERSSVWKRETLPPRKRRGSAQESAVAVLLRIFSFAQTGDAPAQKTAEECAILEEEKTSVSYDLEIRCVCHDPLGILRKAFASL